MMRDERIARGKNWQSYVQLIRTLVRLCFRTEGVDARKRKAKFESCCGEDGPGLKVNTTATATDTAAATTAGPAAASSSTATK
eukprot:20645-Heterococcus_DN1.PRE.1